MRKITSFFWFCSGSDPRLLQQCPSDSSKYVGIGATIFFTGLFAALAAGYALYTVFDNVWAASILGLLWGIMVFNLDRYIVSSMRKEGSAKRELLLASPRIFLAILISVVIAKPLELKIFNKEIQPELVVMEQQKYAEQESAIKARYVQVQDSLKKEVLTLKSEVAAQAARRDQLVHAAQEEADGTGGSKRRNLGPIYRAKKADADLAEKQLGTLGRHHDHLMRQLHLQISKNDSLINTEISSIKRSHMDGPAARIEALDRLTRESSAIAWAHWFIILLFIAIETAPVFVKLISFKGPYDNLLKLEEHSFENKEIQHVAKINAETKEKTDPLPEIEKTFAAERLDALLKKSSLQ